MPKYIAILGGVISGVGKGVATASIAKILQNYGFSVTPIKIDPYINYDAGTLRPTEHGEVWVTDDGGEIDQDLGNYERFLNKSILKKNNITTGQIYKAVIDRERKGEYLGKTVQFIPHIPEEIKKRIKEAGKNHEIVLIEVGGTIGDYENQPFLFALKSLERESGKGDVIYVLVSYLPTPSHITESKTKPTQQAVKMLSENAILPDFILCRAPLPLDYVRKKKIETYANIESSNVISAPDVENIYEVPLNFEKEQLGLQILKKLKLNPKQKPDWTNWEKKIKQLKEANKKVNVAIVGKYLDIGDYELQDSYISIKESLNHAGSNLKTKINFHWIDAKTFENDQTRIDELKNYDGLIIPGGFGKSGVEGKILVIKYCRENNIPFLGLCYGLQLAVIEYARNVSGMKLAHTTEVDPNTLYPVINLQEQQRKVIDENNYGGTMRLGAYAAVLEPTSKIALLYQQGRLVKDMNLKIEKFRLGAIPDDAVYVIERHRHRYEVNPKYVEKLQKTGLIFSGYHERKDGTKLMEFIELKNHKFFCATQSHPEFKSTLEQPAPLFHGFIESCLRP